MRHEIHDRVCAACGRPLEIGETCTCQQGAKGATRDGLRARCPCFEHRSSYRGRYYLACGGKKRVYPSGEARNEHYRRFCCRCYGQCTIYTTMKGALEENAQ